MRTTIRLDDELYRRLKARAGATGRTVGAVIEDTLRLGLDRTDAVARQEPDPLPTYGGSGVLDGVDLSSNAALRETMDADETVDALR